MELIGDKRTFDIKNKIYSELPLQFAHLLSRAPIVGSKNA